MLPRHGPRPVVKRPPRVPKLVAHARVQPVVAVGRGQQLPHRGQHGGHVERGRPGAFRGEGQGVEAHAAAGVDVGVVDRRAEDDAGGFEGVAGGEGDGQGEGAALVDGVRRALETGGGREEEGGRSSPRPASAFAHPPSPSPPTRIWAVSSHTSSPAGHAATPGGGSDASILSSRAMRLVSMEGGGGIRRRVGGGGGGGSGRERAARAGECARCWAGGAPGLGLALGRREASSGGRGARVARARGSGGACNGATRISLPFTRSPPPRRQTRSAPTLWPPAP